MCSNCLYNIPDNLFLCPKIQVCSLLSSSIPYSLYNLFSLPTILSVQCYSLHSSSISYSLVLFLTVQFQFLQSSSISYSIVIFYAIQFYSLHSRSFRYTLRLILIVLQYSLQYFIIPCILVLLLVIFLSYSSIPYSTALFFTVQFYYYLQKSSSIPCALVIFLRVLGYSLKYCAIPYNFE